MTGQQATAIIREIEDICKNHGVFWTKVIEHKENFDIIRLQEISVKIEKQKDR